MRPKTLLNKAQLALTIDRLCHQLIEMHSNFEDAVLISVQPRGIYFGDRLYNRLIELQPKTTINYGKIDPTFYRDDFRRRDKMLTAYDTDIDFPIENKNVILIDDVLFTARTIRAAMDALLDYGRPQKVELMVLVERRFSKHLPITADYIGRKVDAIASQVVLVEWEDQQGKDRVILLNEKDKHKWVNN